MKTFNRYLMLLALAFTGTLASWAQDEVTVTATATDEEWLDLGESLELTKVTNGEWTLAAMPALDIELEIEYETALALDEATGIISIESGQPASSEAVYDLQGRRVNGTAQKGV